jgi:sugar phosphate isomerase/epimerase
LKLAISNIAWNLEEDDAISRCMHEFGVTGVELAPTKIWPKPLEASDSEIENYRRYWNDLGITVSSMQALLFGRADLTIFQSGEKRRETLKYLGGIMRIGGLLGATALVFGSPKNRLVGDLPVEDAESIAVEFFREVGHIAEQYDTMFCIEPNPTAYGCDFVNTSVEGRELVAKVDHPGFGLHLDAAGMTMSGEDIELALPQSAHGLCHFHISEPNLEPIGSGGVDHALFSRVLADSEYNNWCSIEMRTTDANDNVPGVAMALKTVRRYYPV